MPKRKLPLLTTVETLALTAAARLGEAHSNDIFEAIQEVYAAANFATIYTALVRMTWKGYLMDRTGDPEPVRGGRARKFYKLTARGQEALEATDEILSAVKEIRSARLEART